MHEIGDGIEQDFHLAKRYYDQAAEFNQEANVPRTVALWILKGHQYALKHLGEDLVGDIIDVFFSIRSWFSFDIPMYTEWLHKQDAASIAPIINSNTHTSHSTSTSNRHDMGNGYNSNGERVQTTAKNEGWFHFEGNYRPTNEYGDITVKDVIYTIWRTLVGGAGYWYSQLFGMTFREHYQYVNAKVYHSIYKQAPNFIDSSPYSLYQIYKAIMFESTVVHMLLYPGRFLIKNGVRLLFWMIHKLDFPGVFPILQQYTILNILRVEPGIGFVPDRDLTDTLVDTLLLITVIVVYICLLRLQKRYQEMRQREEQGRMVRIATRIHREAMQRVRRVGRREGERIRVAAIEVVQRAHDDINDTNENEGVNNDHNEGD
jgi:hypothetical protein